jgi:hypothetical protein
MVMKNNNKRFNIQKGKKIAAPFSLGTLPDLKNKGQVCIQPIIQV